MITTNSGPIITRVFDLPCKSVWKAWTDPDYFMRWWGPKDFTSPFCKLDLRVDGKYLCCMRSKKGQDFWSTGTYNEIVPLKRIVYTDGFADEKGNAVPASHYEMPGDDWPMELTVTITFEDLGNNTRMTLKHIGLPAGQIKELCSTGWNDSFD